MILYQQVPFTGRGIFGDIFYEPYWFIYGSAHDKDLLDSKYLISRFKMIYFI